jgi:hypothetical protein
MPSPPPPPPNISLKRLSITPITSAFVFVPTTLAYTLVVAASVTEVWVDATTDFRVFPNSRIMIDGLLRDKRDGSAVDGSAYSPVQNLVVGPRLLNFKDSFEIPFETPIEFQGPC